MSFTTSWQIQQPLKGWQPAANYMAQAIRAEIDHELLHRGFQFWMALGSPYSSSQMPTITPIQRTNVTPEAIEQFIQHVERTKGLDAVPDNDIYASSTKPAVPARTVDLRSAAGPNPTVAVRIEHGPVIWETGWYEGRVGYTSRKERRWAQGLTEEDVRISRRRQGVVYNYACPSCGAAADPGQTIRNGGHQGACVNGHRYQVCRLHLSAQAGHTISDFDSDRCSCWMPRGF